ncbi:MAG: PilT/PilU family type 4a pilus ATPase [bacterium]|nr:PilT/PilU family type 4a pilus ATPase [bacterium]
MATKDYSKLLEQFIFEVLKTGASDLHVTAARNPTIRIAGELIKMRTAEVLTPDDTKGILYTMLSPEKREQFEKSNEIDFSFMFEDKARFRVNGFYQRGYVGIAMRLIPVNIRTLDELALPPVIAEFAHKQQGFFIVVGPTGHGKSTTLAAIVDLINHERTEHIITIEDPIEYIFTPDQSIVDQREVSLDTHSFNTALRSMFRQNVDVAMIGEMRDHETISAAVTAAETGHLIFSSLHTNNAAQTIDRIIDSFPPAQQNQIRSQLSNTLLGVFSQRLLPRISGGLIPAYELLISTTAVRNLIRENKIHELDLVIETGSESGMISMDQTLIDLVRKGEITIDVARSYSLNPRMLEEKI